MSLVKWKRLSNRSVRPAGPLERGQYESQDRQDEAQDGQDEARDDEAQDGQDEGVSNFGGNDC